MSCVYTCTWLIISKLTKFTLVKTGIIKIAFVTKRPYNRYFEAAYKKTVLP